MLKPKFERTRPASRPGPYDVVAIAKAFWRVPTAHRLPAIEAVLANVWQCKACEGSRFDFLEADRTANGLGGTNFIPCRICGGEGGIFPDEPLWIDLCVAQTGIGISRQAAFVARIRSPWVVNGPERSNDRPLTRVLRASPTCLLQLECMAYEAVNELLQNPNHGVADDSPLGTCLTRPIVARALKPDGAFSWPTGWEPKEPSTVEWVTASLIEHEATRVH